MLCAHRAVKRYPTTTQVARHRPQMGNFCSRVLHQSCHPRERRSVKKPHLLSTMTDSARCAYIHSCLQSLSPEQVQYLTLMRTLRMNGSRKRSTAYDTYSYYFINPATVKKIGDLEKDMKSTRVVKPRQTCRLLKSCEC